MLIFSVHGKDEIGKNINNFEKSYKELLAKTFLEEPMPDEKTRVIVNFWATYCVACIEELPILNKLSKENNITVIGVNLDEKQDLKKAKKLLNQKRVKFKNIFDDDQFWVPKFNIEMLPTSFVFRNNKLIKKHIGILKSNTLQ